MDFLSILPLEAAAQIDDGVLQDLLINWASYSGH